MSSATMTATATLAEHDAKWADATRNGEDGAAKRRCLCGTVLTAPPRGRTPHSCSERCRRVRQNVMRQRRLRVDWLALWQLQRDAGVVSREEAAVEIAALEADIAELNLRLEPPPVAEEADR